MSFEGAWVNDLTSRLQRWWDLFWVPIDDPASRLFHWNVVVSLLLITAWVLVTGRQLSFRELWRRTRTLIFRRKYWWNRSTRTDYFLYLGNGLLKVFLFLPFLECSYQISQFTLRPLIRWHGDFLDLAPTPMTLALFTVFAFIWDDFLRFLHHWLMHRVPWLWRFHQVHHSARVLTPLTLYRAHPMEAALATVRNSLSTGVATGAFLFLFAGQFSVWTVFGINAFSFVFNLLGANLRHSHIPISFGWLEFVFISPKQHQIHHSTDPRHFARNYGVSLAIWDLALGSLLRSKDVGRLRFGSHGQRADLISWWTRGFGRRSLPRMAPSSPRLHRPSTI